MTHARSERRRASGEPPAELRDLLDELRGAIRAWEAEPGPWPESRFDDFALEAFRLQHRHVRPYRLYCRRRGVDPGTVESWRDVPPVPTAAFRAVDLLPEGCGPAPLLFRTSGTSRGEAHRGRHPVLDPELYRASAEAGFRRFVLGEEGFPPELRTGGAPTPPLPMLSLVSSGSGGGDSSLGWMVDAVMERFGAEPVTGAAGGGGIDWEAAAGWLRSTAEAGRPACVAATTLALDAWTRRLEADGGPPRLPAGSRVMDTGGAKGREGLERGEVLARLEELLGVEPDRVVNELGMTELLSQRYAAGTDGRLHGPPWLRTRALDPVTLEPLPEGEEGVLAHLDLANAASVSAVLTEDRGRVEGGAVVFLGRTPGAIPRGCSLATAELLAAQEDSRDA